MCAIHPFLPTFLLPQTSSLLQVAAPTSRLLSAKLVTSYFPRLRDQGEAYTAALYKGTRLMEQKEEEEEEWS